MTGKQKNRALLLLGICGVITSIFAASLSQLELKPGLPAPQIVGFHVVVPATVQSDPIDLPVVPFILRLVAVLASLYTLFLLFLAIMGTRRRKLLGMFRDFVWIVGAFIGLVLVLFLLNNASIEVAPSPQRRIVPVQFSPSSSAPLILEWLVGITLVVLASMLVFSWIRTRQRKPLASLLVRPVREARQNILDGMDLERVILGCYAEMGAVIQRERSIERQIYTTPTEFEDQLFAAGFPRPPVHELTRLFENVRYGHQGPTQEDRQRALSNLQEIIHHLQSGETIGKDE